MKRNIQIVSLFLISLFLSCSNDDSESSSQREFKEFVVDIDSQTTLFSDNFITDRSSPYYYEYALNASIYNNSKLVIKALDSDTEQSITLTIGNAFNNEPLKVGTYLIGMPKGNYPITNIYYDNDDVLGNNNEYYFNKNYGGHLTGSQIVGEIIISKLDKENKRVKGTFKGKLFGWIYKPNTSEYVASNVNVANGRFDLPYTPKDNFTKDSNIDKGVFTTKIIHEDRDFTFLPTDGVVSGAGTRHFRIQLKMNDSGKPSEFKMEVENENLGVLQVQIKKALGMDTGVVYKFRTDLSLNIQTIKDYIYFFDFYYNTGHVSSPLSSSSEKNDSEIKILSLNKEEKIIEGIFDVRNSTRGVTIKDGYFKVKYEEL